MKRRVRDVMTKTVVVVGRDVTFKEIAERLAEHRVAALPVVDAEGRAVGIVSEADLLVKEQHPDPIQPRFIEGPRRALLRRKAAGTTAAELMSTPVVTVPSDAPLAEAARRMHDGGFRSLPVVDRSGVVIGIVSRRDLLRAFLRPDRDIQEEIEDEVVRDAMWIEPDSVVVRVRGGVVTLHGRLERSSLIPILVGLVQGVDGVVDVVSRLTAEFDDSRVRPYTVPWPSVTYGHGR